MENPDGLKNIQKNAFKCQFIGCNKSFKNKQSLRTHRSCVHDRHPQHQTTCHQCGKITKNKMALTKHMRVHSTNHSCDDCHLVFHRKEDLDEHMEVVHDDEVFNCKYCSKSCESKLRLKNHISHVHEKKFKCRKCAVAFGTSFGHAEHVKSVHEGKRYNCTYQVCRRQFSAKRNAMNHLRHDHDLAVGSDEYKTRCGNLAME